MEKRERIRVHVNPDADWRVLVAEYDVARTTAQRAIKKGYLVVNHCQKGLYPLVDGELPPDFVDAAQKMASLAYRKNFMGRVAYNIEKEDLIQEGVVRLLELAGHPRLGPVGRTHNPALLLREALSEGEFSAENSGQVTRLADYAELLGPDIHVHSDYGDEAGGRTP